MRAMWQNASVYPWAIGRAGLLVESGTTQELSGGRGQVGLRL
jgi:hypothetical protein